MSWQDIYNERLGSVTDAVNLMKDGDRLVLAHCVMEASGFQTEMVRQAKEENKFHGVEVAHMVYMGDGAYLQPEMTGHFRHNALFVGGPARKAVKEHRADVTPCHFSAAPALFRSGEFPIDVFACKCTPPNKAGYVNLGVSCDYGVAAIETAKIVVAEVNENVPATFGDTWVHVSQIDAFYKDNCPIAELQPPKIGDLERQIGKNVADLIHDGDCLQLGIGALPDAILSFLHDKKDLGIHTEMISDGVLSLIDEGVINCSKKQIDTGKIVTTFIMGTRKIYDYVDQNPFVEFRPVDYTNNPYVIAQNDNVVSINSCIEVDLQGQVCSEAIGERQISGIGGQMDFIKGANMSKGGRAILAISSQTKGKSKIVPFLQHGAPVTSPRTDVDYIVTEYGVAHLYGKTLRERARQLINIAHPDDRPALIEEYERRFEEKFPG